MRDKFYLAQVIALLTFTAWGNGNGVYVATTGRGTIWTSSDTITWNFRTQIQNGIPVTPAPAFGNNTFVTQNGSRYVYTSSNGSSWTRRQLLPGFMLSLIFDGSVFIAALTDNSVWSSTNGISWTSKVTSLSASFLDIVYDGSSLVAGGSDGAMWTSTDATTWTKRQVLDANDDIEGVAYGSGVYVAITENGEIWSSANATSWTKRLDLAFGTDSRLGSCVFGEGLFIVTRESNIGSTTSTAGSIISSTDGINWVQRASKSGVSYRVVNYANGIFTIGGGPNAGTSQASIIRGPVVYSAAPKYNFFNP